jgi:hypothetical protein
MRKVGKWAFVFGILVSILAAFIDWGAIPTILVALGLIVGFLNIAEKEAEKFLIAAIALLIIGTASFSALIVSGAFASTTQAILNNFTAFVAAAALVVALKVIVNLGENPKK